jgi:hypothetical protein
MKASGHKSAAMHLRYTQLQPNDIGEAFGTSKKPVRDLCFVKNAKDKK